MFTWLKDAEDNVGMIVRVCAAKIFDVFFFQH